MRIKTMLAVAALFPLLAHSAEIMGKVINAQGAAVAGATVVVAGKDAPAPAKTVTGKDGSYTIPEVKPGQYTLTVSAAAIAGTLRKDISVQGSGPVRADFQFPAAAAAAQLAGADERNPNIFIYKIDLNDLRNRLTGQRGADATYVPEFRANQNYFGSVYGAPLFTFDPLRPRSIARSWHGSVSALHQNSALNARNFFNVGPLLASRLTNYDISAEGPITRKRNVSALLDFSQTFNSGWVNGNVQSPLANERTPRTTDPLAFNFINSMLRAFPTATPNLRAVSLRQLNSNATRDIKSVDGLARVDYKVSNQDAIGVRYFANHYLEDPFQIIIGQNPHTELGFQGLYTNLTHTFSPSTVGRFGAHYDRTKATLTITKQYTDLFRPIGLNAAPDLNFKAGSIGLSGAIGLGPGKQFPRLRVQNRFQYYADLTKNVGNHSLIFGYSIARAQVNDLQSDNARGTLIYSSDFGTDEVNNFLLGRPSSFTVAVGNLYRGFRYFEHSMYVGDQIKISPTFSVNIGARYELMTAPTEVNNLTDIGFPADKNNIAPRIGLAWNPNKGKTTIRAAYGMSYSQIFPVTFGMTRFNPPDVGVVQLQAPTLSTVFGLIQDTSQRPAPGARSALFTLSPDLVFPYSHDYTFSIERELPNAMTARVSYMGLRSFHMLSQQMTNRAAPVPGVVATTTNINDRRPDKRYFEIDQIESNDISYYDALQVSLAKRLSRGLTFRFSYSFSKSIDYGSDFTNTASGVETPAEVGTTTCETCPRASDLRSLSPFDTPHAFAFTYTYNLPFNLRGNGAASMLTRGWQLSGSTVLQSGTAYHVHTGSDGPGFGNVDGNTQDRPNILNPKILGMTFNNPDTAGKILGADTCLQPTAAIPYLHCQNFDANISVGGSGNVGYNVFRKSSTNNWNFALGRTFRLPKSERSVVFRAEGYNIFNRAQFDKPGTQMTAESFGKITNTVNKGRQIQFSLKLNF